MAQPLVLEASWRDVLGVLALFLGFPGTCMICWMIRAYRGMREQRRLDRLEAESLRDEGYPPGPAHPPPSSQL